MVLYQVLTQVHLCGETLERRDVPVDPRVLLKATYGVPYCPKCEVYVWGKMEFGSSKDIGDKLTTIQANTNLSTLGSPFCIAHLKRKKS